MKENNGERAIKGFLRAYMAERKLHKAVAYLDKNIQMDRHWRCGA